MTIAIRATEKLHDLGQSLWLDNITRGLLVGGTLHRPVRLPSSYSNTVLDNSPEVKP